MSPVTSDKSPDSDIPDVGDPERKRLLNVLAQRRYRKRKRDRMAALEAQLKKTTTSSADQSPAEPANDSPVSEANSDNVLSKTTSRTSLHENDQLPDTNDEQYVFSPATLTSAATWNSSQAIENITTLDLTDVFDQFSTSSIDFDTFLNEDALGRFAPATPVPTITSPDASRHSFSDDAILEVPMLKVFNAALELANLLGCAQTIFDPSVSRVLTPLNNPRVPTWLQPTKAQQTIPHHPFIDTLPWPSVRTKLLVVFAQPAHLRPPAAQDDNSLLKLMSDTDDEVDGCRIHGDGFNADDWEVGQTFFSNWWWSLDPHIVNATNEKRVKRGMAKLQLTAS